MPLNENESDEEGLLRLKEKLNLQKFNLSGKSFEWEISCEKNTHVKVLREGHLI